MPVTRKLVAQDSNEENQWLRIDSKKRYVVNDTNDWQFLFGPNSSFTDGQRVLKIAAEFDTVDLSSVRFTAHLYNIITGNVDNASTCNFKVYMVTTPAWTETLVANFSGTIQYNTHFFADINLSALVPAELDGDTTLVVEAVVTRLGETFRDKVYVNHLGVYDSIVRLRKAVDYLDITKLDE